MNTFFFSFLLFYEPLIAQMGHWIGLWMDFKLDEVEEACPFEVDNDFVK